MGKLKEVRFNILCDADGAYTEIKTGELGKLYAVKFELGTLASGGVDVALSYTRSWDGTDVALLTLTNLSANAVYYPQEGVHGNTGAALTLDGTRLSTTSPLVAGALKIVVAQGGNGGVGQLSAYVEC